jgi:4-hydroxybenzoate polyprenyltransferase
METSPVNSHPAVSCGSANRLRALLALSRISRLPTVWSNCLAGWWLGGGGNGQRLPFLFGGATLLYIGGSWLNHAFDAEYDRHHRPARPIPSGVIALRTVWRWGLACLVLGALLLFSLSELTGGLGLGLIFFAILYNTLHRSLSSGPLLKAMCRLFLYLMGASIAAHGFSGALLWCSLALAAYMTGVGLLARWEENPGQAPQWPGLLLLAAPAFALLMNVNGYREPALLLSALLALWLLRAWRQTFWSLEPALGRTVSDLVAGVVFVDWLAVGPVPSALSETNHAPRELSAVFIGLLLVTLLLQRWLPERN